MLDTCVLLARVPSGILVGSIIRDPRHNVFRNVPAHSISIREQRTKLVVRLPVMQ